MSIDGSLLVPRDDGVRCVVVAPDVIEQRQDDGQDDPLFDADDDDDDRRDRRDDELVHTQAADLVHPADLHELDPDEEDDRREHGVRHVLQRLGEEEQDDRRR